MHSISTLYLFVFGNYYLVKPQNQHYCIEDSDVDFAIIKYLLFSIYLLLISTTNKSLYSQNSYIEFYSKISWGLEIFSFNHLVVQINIYFNRLICEYKKYSLNILLKQKEV
jgi:hypothetical protein